MILYLFKYYIEANLFKILSEQLIKKIHVHRFRKIFEWARENSSFYKAIYTEAGVMDLRIKTEDDILKVPVVTKQMMRQATLDERITVSLSNRMVKSLTSGSNGIPLDIYASKREHFTSYVRTFMAIEGFNPFKPFVLIGTKELKEEAEKESFLYYFQKYLGLFRRETISVHNSPDEILQRLKNRRIGVLATTPSCIRIIAHTAKCKGENLNIKRVVLSGELIDESLRRDIQSCFNAKIVNVYGCVEHPSLAWTKPNGRKFSYFLNSVMFEYLDLHDNSKTDYSELLLTNFVNKSMPFIRYKTGDQVKKQASYKYLGNVEGRVDDVISLDNGKKLFMYQMDAFVEITDIFQFKILQKKNGQLEFQVVGTVGFDKILLEQKIRNTWDDSFKSYPINIKFMSALPVNPKSGKFKRMEVER